MHKHRSPSRIAVLILISCYLFGCSQSSHVTSSNNSADPPASPPDAPSALTATAISSTQINLSWTESTGSTSVAAYDIERCAGAGCTNFAQIASATSTSYSDSGLIGSATYLYRVRATDAAGDSSAYSNVATASTPADSDSQPPTDPSSLTATAMSSAQIDLSWIASTDNVRVTAYYIERCNGSGCTSFTQVASAAGTSYSDSGLSGSTTYLYRVRATDAAGNLSGYSNVVSASTPSGADTQAPTAPSGLTAAVISSSQINLSWTASADNTGVTAYYIERCAGTGCVSFTQVASATTTSYGDSGLSGSTTYLYRVRATDAAGNLSPYSNVVTASTAANPDTQPPTAPSGLAATAISSTQINLSWTASTDNVGVTAYYIERCTGAGCASFTQVAAATATAFSNNGLSAATSYGYRIRATDAAGNLSGYSNIATVATPASVSVHTDVVTYKNDLARTGQNLTESALTTANVNASSFGLLRILSADGEVYAQPLYLAQLTVAGAVRNVVFIATEHDSAYAYDADTGVLLWQTTLLLGGETPSDIRGCDQIQPEIGVTATPVIDRTAGPNGVIYIVAMSKDSSGAYHQRLHALDVTTGHELFSGPREIQASYPTQSGTTYFDPSQYKERAALLLLNGEIYTTWASHCDDGPYSGWVIVYSQSSTLAQTRVLNLGPNSDGNGPGLWQGGGGPAVDQLGNIYIMDGNGAIETTLDANGFPSAQDFGNAFVKLSTAGGQLAVTDYFAPWNSVAENDADLDLGGSGPILLPDLADSSGNVKHLVLGASKDGNIYVVDRDAMSGFNPSRNYIWQELDGAVPNGMRTTGAYFNGNVYLADWSATLKAFSITNAKLSTSPTSATSVAFGYPGTSPVVSANGSASGIVWAIQNSSPAVLHAYDATNLATELYNSNQAAGGRDVFGPFVKMTPPTVADGKVFAASTTGVAVFGLLP